MQTLRREQCDIQLQMILEACGGLVHSSQLRRYFSPSRVRQMSSHRICKGWYGINPSMSAVAAARVGGKVSCYSALEYYDLWKHPQPRLRSDEHDVFPRYHVRLGGDARKIRRATLLTKSHSDKHFESNTRIHQSRKAHHMKDIFSGNLESHRELAHLNQYMWLDTLPQVLYCLAICADKETTLCAFDSALHQQLLTAEAVDNLSTYLPIQQQEWLTQVDGHSASGLETCHRLRILEAGFAYESQVVFPGVGRVDGVVTDPQTGAQVVTELDGKEFHTSAEQFHRDRNRDLALARLGLQCLRFTYRQVMHEYDTVLDAIRQALRIPDWGQALRIQGWGQRENSHQPQQRQ